MTPEAPAWISEIISAQRPLMTAKEVAGLLRTSQRNLYRLVASKKLHAVRSAESGSSPLLFPRSSVEKYLRRLEGC